MSNFVSTATSEPAYAQRLLRLQGARWKQILDVQAPYRWHIRSLGLGRVLDLGCGIGRNLMHLDGNGVGVDHNADAVAAARQRELTAYTSEEWRDCADAIPGSFDSLLLAHVVEHMDEAAAIELVSQYMKFVRPGGKVVLITPQERGYATDETHVRLVGFAELDRICRATGLEVDLHRSFPFPRAAGRLFTYNEYVVIAHR